MSFDEVFFSLKSGRWVRRKSWPAGVFYALRGNRLVEHWHDGYERPIVQLPALDVLGDDWEITDD